MAHNVSLSGTFGLTSAHPTALTLKVTFTEFGIVPYAGTSSVKAVISVTNTSDTIERWYRYTDGAIRVTVGSGTSARTHLLKGSKTFFSLGPGRSKTMGTFTWTGVDHTSGSVAVSLSGSYPQGYTGHTSVSASGTLALSNALAAAPTPPIIKSIAGGSGTATINFRNMSGKARNGSGRNTPYTKLMLIAQQAQYPDLFAPPGVTMATITGGKKGSRTYYVQTFWYTTQGTTVPSGEVTQVVTANHLLRINPPSNPPAIATGWGAGISTTTGNEKVVFGKSRAYPRGYPLNHAWIEPKGALPKGSAMPSSPFDNKMFAWQAPTTYTVSSPATASSVTIPVVGSMFYQFMLTAYNGDSWGASSHTTTWYSTGAPPTGGNSSTGSQGEGSPGQIVSPMANVGSVYANALNSVNASASITPVVADIVDLGIDASALTAGAGVTITNYCGDPRCYNPTGDPNTSGNSTASPYVTGVSRADYVAANGAVLPQQMTYAMQALGLGIVDRCMQFSYLGATAASNTASEMFVGGNAAAPTTASSLAIPTGSSSVQASCYVWANSGTVPGTRTVHGIAFNALYANGVSVAGETIIPQPSIPVNTLTQLSASYPIPANSASVTMELWVGTTTTGNAWDGGFLTGDSFSATAFMVLFNSDQYTPYFDGGWPEFGQNIINGGDVGLVPLSSFTNSIDGNQPPLP